MPDVFPLVDGALEEHRHRVTLLEERKKAIKKDGQKRVFTRKGQPIVSMHKAFRAACKEAGVGDRILHDLRRSAIPRMVRKGISETVAMKLSGHKTMSVFRRYDITSPSTRRLQADQRAFRSDWHVIDKNGDHEFPIRVSRVMKHVAAR